MPDAYEALFVAFALKVLVGFLIRCKVFGYWNPSSGQEHTKR